jgi:hypothetical protein
MALLQAIGFFARPRYELVATGEVFDGVGPLGGLMQENVTAFPDSTTTSPASTTRTR